LEPNNGSHSLPLSASTIATDISSTPDKSISIASKLADFQSFVYTSQLKVICVTETWLSELVFDKEILPSHYAIYCKDRGSCGGGVLVAVY